jgi:hypothetical protein
MAFTPILSSVSFALPLVVLAIVGIVWWWATRVSPPSRLAAAPPFRSWKVSPVAAAYSSLRQDQFLLAAYLLRARLAQIALQQGGVAPEDLRTWMQKDAGPALPEPLTLRKVWRHLSDAYRTAYLVEGAPIWETFSFLTVARRRRTAARAFARAAAEVDQVVTVWKEAL